MGEKRTVATLAAARSGGTHRPTVMSATLKLVVCTATDIEPNGGRLAEWYRSTPIYELNEMTAQELVALGRADLLIEFLRSIKRGDRG